MKFQYSYKTYDGSREAIEISQSRAKNRIFKSQACGWGIVFAIISLLDFKSTWYIAIPVILACIGGFYYLVNHYDDVTNRKVACAIFKRKLEKELCISDSSTIRKLMKEFKKELKEKTHNDVPYDKMI